MTLSPPRRLRADSALPQSLHTALGELPNGAPEPAQLDELRKRLGIAASVVVATERPLLVSNRRLKERRLRQTIVALVLFPIAATAAVGTMVDHYRHIGGATATTADSAPAPVRNHEQRVGAHASPVLAPAPALAPEELALPAAPGSAMGSTGLPRAVRGPALISGQASAGATNHVDPKPSASEVELLQRANAALKSDPAQALSLIAEHRRLYFAGNLAQEREVIAIKASVALADFSSARDGLLLFERAYPRSAYVLELRRIVR